MAQVIDKKNVFPIKCVGLCTNRCVWVGGCTIKCAPVCLCKHQASDLYQAGGRGARGLIGGGVVVITPPPLSPFPPFRYILSVLETMMIGFGLKIFTP